jgi:signal transduction histidine kinase
VLDTGEHRLFRLRGPEGDGQLVGLCLPLRTKERVDAMLEAYGPESLAGEDAVEFLRSLAAQAASALENARLYNELAEREARLKELVGKLLTAQEEERRRVAYEVHDGLTQVAVSSYQHLQAFAAQHPPGSSAGQEMLDRCLGFIRRTVDEARRVIADLRPTVLDDFGLETALRLQVDDLNDEGWQIDFRSGSGAGRLPVAVETALYRVTQEALTNVRKHSGDLAASVELERAGRCVWLRIEDRGKGFDAKDVPKVGGPGERVGLSSMRERVELVGGTFEIRSEEGVGTTIRARVPLPDDVEMEKTGLPTPPKGRR